MHTLILLLAIILIGVVAAVVFPQAAGGDALPGSEEPVLAEQALPPPGERVTADDVAVLQFPLAFRGYRPAEVEAVLDRLAAELEARDAVIADLVGRPRVASAEGDPESDRGSESDASASHGATRLVRDHDADDPSGA